MNGWLGHLLSQGMAATVFGNGCIFVSERLAGPCQRLAASVLGIGWLGLQPYQRLAARSVFGCKPRYQTTTLCAALTMTERVLLQWLHHMTNKVKGFTIEIIFKIIPT